MSVRVQAEEAVLVLIAAAAILLPSVLATALGATVRRGALGDRWPLLVCTVVVVLVGVTAGITHDPRAASVQVFFGTVVAALGFAAVPLAAYYALGRLVATRAVLATVWLLSLVPLGLWLSGTLVLWFSLAQCPFFSDECP